MTPNESKEFGNELLCSIYGRIKPWLNNISYQVEKKITFYKKQNHLSSGIAIDMSNVLSFFI